MESSSHFNKPTDFHPPHHHIIIIIIAIIVNKTVKPHSKSYRGEQQFLAEAVGSWGGHAGTAAHNKSHDPPRLSSSSENI